MTQRVNNLENDEIGVNSNGKTLCYREFLTGYLEKKRESREISFRQLAKKAGLGSPNHIQNVINGRKNLSVATASRLAEALGMSAEDASFFRDLVLLNTTAEPLLRETLKRRLIQHRFAEAAGTLEKSQTKLFKHWYTPIVWAFAPLLRSHVRCLGLVKMTGGLISIRDVERALSSLVEEGFLVQNANGEYANNNEILQIQTSVAKDILEAFYVSCFNAAKRFVNVLPSEKRNMRVSTLAIDSQKIPELQERVRAFHKEIVAWLAEDESVDCVVQLSSSLGIFQEEK